MNKNTIYVFFLYLIKITIIKIVSISNCGINKELKLSLEIYLFLEVHFNLIAFMKNYIPTENCIKIT